jgi:pyruvate/2-oxoglutarate dehydrogenase complex dihydrolipoamide acyltransferase (E2) component
VRLRDSRPTIQKFDVTGFAMRLEAVILPELGTGPDMPIVVSHWYAGRGEIVWEGDRLVEVLAGPLTFDVAAPATGRLVEIRGREDDLVEPGSVLGYVALNDERDGGGDDVTERNGGSGERGPGEPPRRSGRPRS